MEIQEIRNLFESREQQYIEHTAKILSQFSSATTVIDSIIRTHQLQGEKLVVNWNDVYLIEEHDLVVLIVSVSYAVGTRLNDPESASEIEVTENNSIYFNKLVKFVIPLTVALEQDKQKIFDLLQTNRENNLEISDDYRFDTTLLSDEQKKSLNLYMLSSDVRDAQLKNNGNKN